MRWKAIMYDDTGCKQQGNVEKYGLKNTASPEMSQKTFRI